ncbi:hypothetical protein V6N13_087559 [Hibiscus sabdariffa]
MKGHGDERGTEGSREMKDPPSSTSSIPISDENSWILLPADHVKFSMDGAANPNKVECGGVFREECENIRIMFTGPLSLFGAEYAELMVIFVALDLFKEAD